MYLTNNQRLDLGLVGASDLSVADIQAAMTKVPGVYVADVAQPAPPAPRGVPGAKGGSGKT